MLDNAIITLLISTIAAQQTDAGIGGIPIIQAYQPIPQGVNKKPTIFLYKVSDRRVGYPGFGDTWINTGNILLEGGIGEILAEGDFQSLELEGGYMNHQQLQKYESTFQFSALAIQDPSTPNNLTASDILNLVSGILQSSATVATLEAQGVGIQRISNLYNPYFLDDRNRNEAASYMDIVITHQQILLSTTPIFETVELDINRV